MNTELTTRIASEEVAATALPLSNKSKAQAPVQRDDTQPRANANEARRRLLDDPEKVKEIVKETVDYFEKFVKNVQVDLKYEIDEKTNDVIVKVFERGTDRLIRQVPPEAILKLKQRISDLLGIIYDEMF